MVNYEQTTNTKALEKMNFKINAKKIFWRFISHNWYLNEKLNFTKKLKAIQFPFFLK